MLIQKSGINYANAMKYRPMQKKIFLVLGIIVLCMAMFTYAPERGEAVVGGDCDACHSLYPGMMEKTLRGKPFQFVLRDIFCINCHSHNTSETIKLLGGNRVPVVFNNVKPVHPLAGGNFYPVARDFGDRKGHNVKGIASVDAKFRNVPPGYSRKLDPSLTGYDMGQQLSCAGTNGCHGDRNIEDPFEAVFGAHHAVGLPIDGSTTAKSYRYLRNAGKVKGVTGYEDNEWNRHATADKHNEYTPSIDEFCTSCHGEFHTGELSSVKSPWFRHPTGIVLPSNGEYAKYRTYNPDAPVARPVLPQSPSNVVTPGKDAVSCLSCHLAHAGPYESLLRWDYDNIFTGEDEKGGCIVCHTGK